MDANQRSTINNQTNNGANEKSPRQGDDRQLDHTHPQGGFPPTGNQQRDVMGTTRGAEDAGIPGGSMDNQINGGSGTTQGVTDSHERQMGPKSGAYGKLEQDVRKHHKDGGGTDLNQQRDRQASTQGGGMMGPQGGQSLQSGSMSGRSAASSQGGGMAGPGARNVGGQEAQRGNTQLDVAGSRSMSNQHADAGGVHQSNDAASGLPRAPGGIGADHAASSDRTGSQTGGPDVHDSNDAAGGYPRSPGYANKLKGDQNMDDDTGFKRKP